MSLTTFIPFIIFRESILLEIHIQTTGHFHYSKVVQEYILLTPNNIQNGSTTDYEQLQRNILHWERGTANNGSELNGLILDNTDSRQSS